MNDDKLLLIKKIEYNFTKRGDNKPVHKYLQTIRYKLESRKKKSMTDLKLRNVIKKNNKPKFEQEPKKKKMWIKWINERKKIT